LPIRYINESLYPIKTVFLSCSFFEATIYLTILAWKVSNTSSILTQRVTISAMAIKKPDSFTLPTQHFRMALRMFAGAPELIDTLLNGSGVTVADLEDPEFALPISALWPIWDNATAQFGEGWFLDLPILWSVEVQSEFGLAMRLAANLAEAIDVVEEFWHVRWPIGRAIVTRDDAGYRLSLLQSSQFGEQNWKMGKSLAALNFATTARAIVGDDANQITYGFEGPPPIFAKKLEGLLAARVTWNNELTSVFVPRNLLSEVSPLVNRGSYLAMIDSLRRRAATQSTPDKMAAKVTEILDNVESGQLDVAAIAGMLGLSSRTLERRLASEGRTFRQLAAYSFRKRLEALLAGSNTTADALADQLGYHDGSSLMRACRRYLGKPLSQVRDELKER
jgi:AraC-like DNA-binding protein